jgi:hypothetical protein
MKIGIIAILMMIQSNFQSCREGCLRCQTDKSVCLFCDTSKNYFLKDNSCALSTESTCMIYHQDGKCQQCNVNHYIDPNTFKCLQTSEVNKQINCALFGANQVCLQCNPGFYPDGKICSKVVNQIGNCLFYYADGACKICNRGFVLSASGSSCVSTSKTPNCLHHNFLKCLKCSSNFILNHNSYFSNFQNLEFTNTLANSKNEQNLFKLSPGKPLVCLTGKIEKCIQYTDVETCALCDQNFFLSENKCIAFPTPSVSNCLNYTNEKTCSNCKQKFYLSQNACLPIEVIEGCIRYSSTSSSTVCDSCDQANFLSDSGSCTVRVDSIEIENCKLFSPTSDKCQECFNGFDLTSDGLACLESVLNCETHVSGTSKTSTQLVCQKCNKNAYLVTPESGDPECVLGQISNCVVYNANLNECIVCAEKFYLLNDICLSHTNIPNCKFYNSETPNMCDVCTGGYFSFELYEVCQEVANIANCIEYSTDGSECYECASGFYLDGNLCVKMPSALTNCLMNSGPDCSKCDIGFMLDRLSSPQNCVEPFDYLKTNCIFDPSVTSAEWPTTTQANFLKCSICFPGTIAYTPLNPEAICVKNSQLSLNQYLTTVQNCFRYGRSYDPSSTSGLVCMQCTSDFVINAGYSMNIVQSKPTTCIIRSACNTENGDNAIIIDDLFGFVNVCMNSLTSAITDKKCQFYARRTSQNQNLSDFVCLKPTSNYIFQYSFQTTIINFEENTVSSTALASTSTDYFQGFNDLDGPNGSLFPSSFNWRGSNQALTLLQKPTPFDNSLNNCDIVWNVGEQTVKGSAFKTGQPYTQITGVKLSCLKCLFGYHPQFTIIDVTGNSPTPVCVSMSTTCANPNYRAGGLPTYLVSILSCHSCAPRNGQKAFPTIVMEYVGLTSSSQKGTFLQFSLPSIDLNTKTASEIQGFACLAAPKTIATSNDQTPPENNQIEPCEVYGVLSSITTSATNPTNTYSYCLACRSGYYPIYLGAPATGIVTGSSNHPAYIVKSCQQSNKCENNPPATPYNSCGKCTTSEESNLNPIYYAFSDFRAINCFKSFSKNCFILNFKSPIHSSNPNQCLVCMNGFFLNKDMQCESMLPPHRQNGATFSISYYYSQYKTSTVAAGFDSVFIRIHYLLSFFGPQYGVSNCEPSYTLASPHKLNSQLTISADSLCFESSYLSSNVLVSNTVYVLNCLKYSFTQSAALTCEQCISGYIITADKKNCVEAFSACSVSMDFPKITSCSTCSNGFLNVGGKCTNQRIPNCSVHLNTANSFIKDKLECDVCNPGYYLSMDKTKCTEGLIFGCKSYTIGSPLDCISSNPGFALISVADGMYNYPILKDLNCLALDEDSLYNDPPAVTCLRCASTSTVIRGRISFSDLNNPKIPATVCMPFNSIDNCLKYDSEKTSFTANTFKCVECITGFYVSESQKCVLRQIKPANCQVFNIDSDTCNTCKGGTYLSEDERDCLEYPKGIGNCIYYSSLTQCQTCDTGYFLNNNACVRSTPIADCESYKSNRVCQKCASGHFLASPSSCVKATATFCLTYVSASSCESCIPGYLLIKNGQNNNCQKATIENCAEIATEADKATCKFCVSKFYLDQNTCSEVENEIFGCLVYDSKTTCSICAGGTSLSFDKKLCDSQIFAEGEDKNCIESLSSDTPFCQICDLGFYFKDGSCVKCGPTGKEEGCWVCNPLSPDSCLFCSSDYFMNEKGTCLSLKPGGSPITPMSISNLKYFSILIGVLMMVAF